MNSDNIKRAKEIVKLRTKKTSNGSESLYLDIYYNGQRRYEFLKLYLLPPTTEEARKQNAKTMQSAQAIKARRTIEVINKRGGINDYKAGEKITLGAFLLAFITKYIKTGHNAKNFNTWQKQLRQWKLDGTKLAHIDKEFCLRYIDLLRSQDWAEASKYNAQVLLIRLLNEAKRSEIIPNNPFDNIATADRFKQDNATKEFLSIEEVNKLIATPIKWEKTKQAFLFACFTGLRISDIKALKWENIKHEDEQTLLRFKMQKTKQNISVPLTPEAMRWLPDIKNPLPQLPIYPHLAANEANRRLKIWGAAAGITDKNLTFHVARHTFATMLITLGADLYTVSKLLGHSNITVTQVYAKLVDKKKTDAVNLFRGNFGGGEKTPK